MNYRAAAIFWLSVGIGGLALSQMFLFSLHLFLGIELRFNVFQLCLNLLKKNMESHSYIDYMVVSFIGYTFLNIVYRMTKQCWLAYRFNRDAPLLSVSLVSEEQRNKVAGKNILVMPSPVPCAFTYGLFRRKIVLSSAILKHFSHREVEAIIFHEEYHQRFFDPLKIFILTLLAESFKFIPIMQELLIRYKTYKELLADQYAMAHMGSSVELGSALLKLIKANGIHSSMATVSFSETAVNYRIQQILEPDTRVRIYKSNSRSAFVSMGVLLLMVGVVLGGC